MSALAAEEQAAIDGIREALEHARNVFTENGEDRGVLVHWAISYSRVKFDPEDGHSTTGVGCISDDLAPYIIRGLLGEVIMDLP